MDKKGSRESHFKKKGNYVEQVRNQDPGFYVGRGRLTVPKWTRLPKCIFIV